MACPICKKTTVAEYQPFCSKRCADIDLGKWLKGDYVIAASDEGDTEDVTGADVPHTNKLH